MAIERALGLDGAACVDYAREHSWADCAQHFRNQLVPCRAGVLNETLSDLPPSR